MRTVPQCALDLIHRFEQGPHGGFAETAYIDPAGIPTIGWGHALKPGDPLIGARITEEEADATATDDLNVAAGGLYRVPGPTTCDSLSDNEYGALLDFVFNEGIGHFAGSTMCHFLETNQLLRVPDEFSKWVYGGGKVLPGLVTRRSAERVLWLTP